MNAPLVSVYITNYNYGRFIREAINSVLKQTLQDFELIIIDDGSTDESLAVIDDYLHLDKVSLIRQKNKGLNVSNNVALYLAKGKYIVRLDADDYFEENALEELVKPLELDDSIGLAFPDYKEVDAEGGLIKIVKRHDFANEVELFDQPAHGACTMVRTHFLKDLGGYDESFSCQDGFDLWIKFVTNYRVTNVNKLLFNYRQHGFNLTKNEDRLLSTRSEMKKKYLENTQRHLPNCSIVIPIRSLSVSETALIEVNGESLIEKKINASLKSEIAQEIIILTSDKAVKDLVRKKFDLEKIKIIDRPKLLSSFNTSLIPSLKLASDSELTLLNEESVVILLSLESPLLNTRYIDSSVRSMMIFNADSVVSVRRNSKSLYTHSGKSITPVQSTELTKYERDDLFESSGGLVTFKLGKALEQNKTQCGVVSHILVDEVSGFELKSHLDIKIAELLENSLKETNQIYSVIR